MSRPSAERQKELIEQYKKMPWVQTLLPLKYWKNSSHWTIRITIRAMIWRSWRRFGSTSFCPSCQTATTPSGNQRPALMVSPFAIDFQIARRKAFFCEATALCQGNRGKITGLNIGLQPMQI